MEPGSLVRGRCGPLPLSAQPAAIGPGRREHDATQSTIFDAGIFGVPSFIVNRELFWGREHLPMVRWLLGGKHGPAPDIAYRQMSQEAPS